MLDETSVIGKTVAAAMQLAAERSWQALSLRQIAEKAGVSLAELRDEGLTTKGAILVELVSLADRHVLKTAPRPDPDQPARDRLFEVLMCRLDALEPYKPALKSVARSAPSDFRLCRQALASQAWMLEAAGISSEGVSGALKAAGLATVYLQVVRTWLDDDDPGQARTLAALDRQLRRGERAVAGLDEAVSGCNRVCKTVTGFLKRVKSARDRNTKTTDAQGDADNATSGAAPDGDGMPDVHFPNASPGSA